MNVKKALKLTYLIISENPRNTQVFMRGIFRGNDCACDERVLNRIWDMTLLNNLRNEFMME